MKSSPQANQNIIQISFEVFLAQCQAYLVSSIYFILLFPFHLLFCLKSEHKYSSLKLYTFTVLLFNRSSIWVQLDWILCLGSHSTTVKVSTQTVASAETNGSFPSSSTVERSFHCSCRTFSILLLQGQRKRETLLSSDSLLT